MPEGALQQRIVAITGAASGLGREYARAFAAEGARLVLADRGAPDFARFIPSALEELRDELTAEGAEVAVHYGDVGDEKTSNELVELAVDSYGGLDVLINNAGNWYEGELIDSDIEAWDSVIRTHLRGTFLSTRAVGRYWRSRQGAGSTNAAAIINTSSRSALKAIPTHGVYAAAKAGTATLTQVAAQELAKYGVRVNCVVPAARTPMAAQVSAMQSQLANAEPAGFDELAPGNVAPLVGYLATESCPLTGEIIFCRGGSIEIYSSWSPGPTLEKQDRWTISELADRLPGHVQTAE